MHAIQFQLDQLLVAPTPKLIAFIHWYCCSQLMVYLPFNLLLVQLYTIEQSTRCFN